MTTTTFRAVGSRSESRPHDPGSSRIVGPYPAPMDEDVTPLRLQGDGDPDGPAAQEQWEAGAAAVLRKARRLPEASEGEPTPTQQVWDLLTRTTLDGVRVPPIGSPGTTRADGVPLPDPGVPGAGDFTRGVVADTGLLGWDVRIRLDRPDLTAADVLGELETGANSLWLRVAPGAVDAGDLTELLRDVRVDLAPVALDAPVDPVAAAQALVAAVESQERPSDLAPDAPRMPGSVLGRDPWSEALRGAASDDSGTDTDLNARAVATLTALADLALPHGAQACVIDATAVADLGGSEVQQLAFSLAAGAASLRVLAGAGHDPATAARLLTFRYAVGDEQFTGIAMLRAARRLWARVLQLSGVPDADRGQRQHAVTSRAMLAAYDPYTNLLRTTVAAFAAGAGGAGSVTVTPFDDPRGRSTPFSRRMARNISILLIEESHVAVAHDPAGGAPAVERLTDDLARAAWEMFTTLEADGGPAAALDDGSLLERIVALRDTRAAEVARRTRPLTGLTEFPQSQESPLEREPHPATEDVVHRHGAAFEALRDDPVTEPVFLATLGPLAAHADRARFVTNLLAAGALRTDEAGPTPDVEALLASWRGAGSPPVVVVASGDAVYEDWGRDAVTALRDAGASHVVTAGRLDLGGDARVALGDDVLTLLTDLRRRLRAASSTATSEVSA